MKLLIAGSRSIKDFDISSQVDSSVDLIITGGACGIDTIAEEYADRHKISKLVLRPDYKRYGKGAPLIRNKKMVEFCDRVLVIWDGKSSGTKFTVEYAKSIGKELILININESN